LTLACLPTFPISIEPTVEARATATLIAKTPTLLSTATVAPVTQTSSPVVAPPVPQISDTPALPLLPDLTTTPATATSVPVISATTNTATLVTGLRTFTPTLGILTYGTLPPDVPSTPLIIWNRSKAQAYISLQVTLNDGRYAILEYPVTRRITIDAPIGSYVYVAWVGGKKMDGGFRLHSNDHLTIILYKDRIVIQ